MYIKIQTVDVREIKEIVGTERQITGSEWTERGELGHHVTELLGSMGFTLRPHDPYLPLWERRTEQRGRV